MGFLFLADSLKVTSGISVGLAVVFLVITVGITLIKLMNGSILMPRLLPNVTDFTSFLNLFTVVPVLVTAYICHYNGTLSDFSSVLLSEHLAFIFLRFWPGASCYYRGHGEY